MVQTAPSAQHQVSDQHFNQPLGPEQVARIQEVCRRLKMKSLKQIEFLPRSTDFLAEFTKESEQPWAGHCTELLEFLQAEVGEHAEIVSPAGYQRVTKEAPHKAIVIQEIYPNG